MQRCAIFYAWPCKAALVIIVGRKKVLGSLFTLSKFLAGTIALELYHKCHFCTLKYVTQV